MHVIARSACRRAAGEGGFTMVATMGVLMVVMLFSVAAFAATDGDFKVGGDDKERKAAYAAAEAGVNDYLARLIADTDYWRKCSDLDPVTKAPLHPGLNLKNPPAAQRRWMAIPGSTAQYSIEVLPNRANAAGQCDPNNAQSTFIEASSGTFRIRSTGRSSATSRQHRSVVATLRRRGFLDYIYFTDFETQNPAFYARNANGLVTRENPRGPGLPQRSIIEWAEEECATYWHEGRGEKRFNGLAAHNAGIFYDGKWHDMANVRCGEINFVSGDALKGPMHTNDSIAVCGSPTYGRQISDDIEVSGPGIDAAGNPRPGEGWRQTCGGGAPQVNYPESSPMTATLGVWRKNAPLVTLPPSNASLKDDALPSYRFKGKTTISLAGTTMTVTSRRESGVPLTNVSMPVPADGVIYVANGDDPGKAACTGYQPLDPLAASDNCGDVWLKGTYGRSITITAENDIVLEDDVQRSGDHLLGLISNNFIRVHHPVAGTCGDNNGGPGAITIEAAILSLRNSFTVDRWWCGDQIGTLTVKGAIAQKFRGTVGQIGNSGYLKDYQYDDRLRFRSPPRFLDPVQAGWRIQTYVEQVPAAR